MRVAVVEIMAADRALPLILDDPFLHFDDRRLARVERMLERVGSTHQIILLTHDARLSDWSFPCARLPEPVGPSDRELSVD
jgi:chromosome segregation protein